MDELESLKNSLLSTLQNLQAQPNPDTLHDFRVSVRRFLANVNLSKIYRKPLKKIFRLSSPIRDVDTLVLKIEELGLKYVSISKPLIAKNIMQYYELLALVTKLDINNCVKNIDQNIQDSMQDSTTNLHDDFEHICRQLVELLKKDGLVNKEELHLLRKKLKKIRYRFEHNKITTIDAISSFKHLQDMLGYINDRHTWRKILRDKELHNNTELMQELRDIIREEEENATIELKTMFSQEFYEEFKKKLAQG